MRLLLQTRHFRIIMTGIMIIGQFLHFTLSHCYDVVKVFLSGMIQSSDSNIVSSTSFAALPRLFSVVDLGSIQPSVWKGSQQGKTDLLELEVELQNALDGQLATKPGAPGRSKGSRNAKILLLE